MSRRLGSSLQHRARAAGLVRAIVVATSTLAILVVCFSIYQASQETPEVQTKTASIAPPSARGQPDKPNVNASDAPGISTGIATLGPGQKIHMTFYPKSGQQGRVELAVESWTPIAGSANDFVLIEPEIRMRTDDGHAVRITAKRGVLEAERNSGTGLNPQRGRLSEGIVILYDRLTEKQRADLPEDIRYKIDPADLVRIEMEELEFDLEYGKLVIPGDLHLTASDVDFLTSDLEIRFNDAQNRVEQLRINGGGRLSLLASASNSGISMPSIDPDEDTQMSLVEWLRASIQSKLAGHTQSQKPTPEQEAVETRRPTETKDGVPILRIAADQEGEEKPDDQYFAKFEGGVEVTQRQGDVLRSQLTADVLEIIRSLSDKQKQAAGSSAPNEKEGKPQSDPPSNDRIDLQWTDRLFVQACEPQDPRCDTTTRSSIRAIGSPARIIFAQGSATCRELSFEPDSSKVWLHGTQSQPAIVDMNDAGLIHGRTIYTERKGDDLIVSVTGPGKLVRSTDPTTQDQSTPESNILFSESLEIRGRYELRTRLETKSGLKISRKRELVLDQAIFVGDVKMKQDDTALEADKIALSFAPTRTDPNTIEHVTGTGHVTMTLGSDQVWCREVHITLETDSHGKTIPITAVAKGDVIARQGQRTIKANDHLTVDFAMFDRPAPPFDLAKAREMATAAGKDPDTIDWNLQRTIYEQKDRREPGAKRLRASGAVNVVDPVASLNITAESIDCDLVNGGDITKALIRGTPDHPASVTLDTMTIVGPQILLNVPQQKAEVPAAGRLTFLSNKDLDGKKLKTPTPIAITWSDSMRYLGQENRSVFTGDVHATSKSGTTFDCDRLQIDFEDVQQTRATQTLPRDAWSSLLSASEAMPGPLSPTLGVVASLGMAFEEQIDQITAHLTGKQPRDRSRFSKEPASILATGKAVAVTSEFDEQGVLLSRSSISGPKLSVNLRSDASKLLIEGPGSLLLEDLKTPPAQEEQPKTSESRMFGVNEGSGPSNTLIQWDDMMWYDFSIAQTRFSGNVQLSYISGAKLMQVRDDLRISSDTVPIGRTTFLACEQLTVDFASPEDSSSRSKSRSLGGLSTDRLKQFEARYGVILQDNAEGLNLTAERVIFRKDSCMLSIHGTDARKAHIVKKRPGQLPHQVSVKHLFYNTCTGEIKVSQPELQSP